jgi:uroporphyrinogen decarboxylase
LAGVAGVVSYAGRNRRAVNLLKAITFDGPDWTPCRVGLMPATWMRCREELEELVLAHPRIFPDYERGRRDFDAIESPLYELGRHTDCWGVVWENRERGLDSIPIEHPLEDWSALGRYVPPDPLRDDTFGPRDWEGVRRELQAAKGRGDLAKGDGLLHGFMYMRLYYLRGFENLMLDLARKEPQLRKLIRMVETYNDGVIRRYLDLGAEYMSFGDDLGMQNALPMSPATWRAYIKPSYERLFRPCREAGVPIYLHTDGHILEIIPDLVEVGVRVLNPQLRANGLEGLKEMAKGRVAIDQDLDRQLFPFATPAEIEEHVGEVFEGLYSPQGGLMLYAECEPDVPLENIDAICTALERVCRPPEP